MAQFGYGRIFDDLKYFEPGFFSLYSLKSIEFESIIKQMQDIMDLMYFGHTLNII